MRTWLALSLVLASVAVAAPKKPTVVLSGPPSLTRWVSKELSKKYTPKALGTPVSAAPTANEVREVTGPQAAIALVLCQASGQFITLQVLNGADGTPLDTVTIKGTEKKPPKSLPKAQLAALFFAVGSGKAPAAAVAPVAVVKPEVKEPAPEPKKAPESRPEPVAIKPVTKAAAGPVATVVESPAAESKPSPHPAVRLSVGVGGFNRSFAWAGNPSQSLASITMPFSGALSVDASWYPGAHFTSSFAANLGLFGSGDFGLGIVSRLGSETSTFAHSATRLRFGALVRLPLGDRFVLNAHLGYARHEVTTSALAVNDGSARPNLPNVLFNGFRGGLGLRLRIAGTLELDALGGVQAVAGTGEVGSAAYFPKATAFAVDAGGGLSIELVEHVRLRAGAEWQRYFVALNPADTSTFFAKTLADQYISATASLQWVM